MYIKSYYRIPTSEASIYLRTFTSVCAPVNILREVLPVWHSPNRSQQRVSSTTQKSHFKDDLCHEVQSQPGVPSQGPGCPGDLVQRSSFRGSSNLLFIPFSVTECRTSLPRIIAADSCFPGMTFLITVSVSCTHQGFFVLPTTPHQEGLSRAYQRCLRAPAYGDVLCQYVCQVAFVAALSSSCIIL